MATTRKDIEAALWRGANTFRGAIDAANYKDYILPMLFVKYLSDTYLENVEDLRKKYDNPVRLERAKSRLPFIIKEEHSFLWLYDKRYDDSLGELINTALRGIEDDNPSLFTGIFRNIDFNSEAMLGNQKQRNTRLRELLEDFKTLDLSPSSIKPEEGKVAADTIGEAYEYMIGEFAGQAGKKAGSFFTPSEVSELIARIVDPKISDIMYDPTCGSGSLLIFKKNRNRDDVLFIDASGKDENSRPRYKKDKNQNKLETKHIEDIVSAYKNRADIKKFAHVAGAGEIRANGYNLNIPRYVDTFEEEALVDIEEVKNNIANIQKELDEVGKQMAGYLKELGL